MRPKSPFKLVFVFLILLIIFQINGALSQTFPGTGGLAFPPSGTIGVTQSTCNVTGIGILGGCKTIANVTIDLDHTWTGDIALILIAPNGTFIELSSANGGSGNDYKNTVFTDSAPTNIVSGSPPFTGTFRPEGRQNTSINNPYSNANAAGTFTFANTFNGINADGAWTLYLNDYVGLDVGFLNSWSITFTNGTNFTVDLGPDISACAGSNVTVNASNTAPNPISYNWSNGGSGPSITIPSIVNPLTLTVTVTDQSGCRGTDTKMINVNASPTGNAITISQCETIPPGQATFNLTSSNSSVGPGFSVSWYSDAGVSIPIPNPTGYISTSATVYAVVFNAICSSLPVPITLTVTQIPVSSYGMDIIPAQICQPGMIPVSFTLPSAGSYTYQYSLVCTSGTDNNSITTANNPVMFNITGDCTLNISQITQGSTGCTTFFSPPLTDNIAIESPPSIMVNTMEICSGQSLNLADFVTTDAGAVLTFHNASPPLAGNQLPSLTVEPLGTTTYYALSTGPNCSTQAPLTVTVVPEASTFTTSVQLCENASAINLTPYVTPSNLTGSWSGTGVTGSNFDPAGLQGNIVITFDPDNTCYLNGTLTVQLNPVQTPVLDSDDICPDSGPFDLTLLQDPAFPNGTWSGTGVTGTTFNPGSLTGVISLTFSPTGQCVSSAMTTIEINPLPKLIMQDNINACSGASVNLSDYISNSFGNTVNFYNSLPAIPSNEITNTTVTITSPTNFFAKATDQNGCFIVIPFTVNISPSGTPVDLVIPWCETAGNIGLNQYLNPAGLAGVWSGLGVSGSKFNPLGLQGDIILTFDPVDICYLNGTITAQITSLQTPDLLSDQVCSSSDPVDLNTLIDPAFPVGQWSGTGVTGDMFNPVSLSGTINLTFNPSGQCVAPGMTTIEIFNDPDLQFNANNVVCSGETINLVNFVNNSNGYILNFYTSNPPIPVNEIINTSVTIITTTTYIVKATDLNGCFVVLPMTINAAQGESPVNESIAVCSIDGNINLSQYLNPQGLTGVWTGPGVSGNFFDPFGYQGNLLLSFDPDNVCYTNGTLTINVIPANNMNLQTAEVCQMSDPIDLSSLEDPLFVDGIWSGSGVSGDVFYPASLSGNIILTFTPTNGCVYSATTNILVIPPPGLQIITIDNICEGTSIQLQDYVINSFGNDVTFYKALPAVPSDQIINTNITINNSSQYYIKVTDQNGCYATAQLSINMIDGGTPDLGIAVVCKNDVTYNLNILNDPLAGSGAWSGNGVINNVLNLSSLSGIVNVTFTPDNQCLQPATTYVEIRNPINLNLGTTNLCSSSGNFDLTTLADPLLPAGVWSGTGVTNNIFNPTSLSGPVLLSFISSEYCVNSSTTTINVTTTKTPTLKNIKICETIDTFSLSSLQDPLYTNGTWSGTGVKNSEFYSVGLTGLNTISFTSLESCVLPSGTTIEVLALKTPALLNQSICASANPISLTTAADPAFPTGIWSGPGVNNNIFDPAGLAGPVSVFYQSDTYCTLPASTIIKVHGTPVSSDLKITCNPTSEFYAVNFNISGGDTMSYMVNGITSGTAFASSLIPSGNPYNFNIADANQCQVITLQGIKNCDCLTNAGSMDLTNSPLNACTTELVLTPHYGDQTLDPNDKFLYILHDNPGLQAGNIFATSPTPQFYFPPNGIIGKTYYISAIAGDSLQNGNIKTNDVCFSIAAGIPVVFYKPDINISKIDDVCAENCAMISAAFNGIPPYNLIYEIIHEEKSVSIDTVVTVNNTYKYTFCPIDFNVTSGNTKFRIISFTDKHCSPEIIDSFTIFNVGAKRTKIFNNILCKGESIVVNGIQYNEVKPKGVEVIPSGTLGQCDSIIQVDLSFFPVSTHSITKSICENQSIVVNGSTYDKYKLSGIETVKNGNVHGCDSIININLTLVNEIVTSLNQTLCRGESIMVNGQVYDENRPSGTELFLGNGTDKCDSTVNISLTFNDKKMLSITDTLCADNAIFVHGKKYDIEHAEGIELLKNGAQNGCDSIIQVKLSFFPVVTDTLVKYLKKGDSIKINGVLFNEGNNKGLTVKPELSSNGCRQFEYVIVYFEQDIITANIETKSQSCPDINDGKIIISNISGCSDYKLKINGALIPFATFPFELSNLSPGTYQIEISGNIDCLMTKTISVMPSSSTGFKVTPTDFKMQFGVDIELKPEILPTPAIVLWEPAAHVTCSDCLFPMTRDITDDINYYLTLSDTAGCTFQYNIQLFINKKEIEITFPNIFSPNGDGMNDYFEVKSTTSQQINRLTIFDRWGSQLFDDVKNPGQESIIWDGKSHDKTIQPGVYIYLAEIMDASGNKKYVYGDLTISF